MRKHGRPRCIHLLTLVLPLASGTLAAAALSHDEVERQIVSELSQQNPAAVQVPCVRKQSMVP